MPAEGVTRSHLTFPEETTRKAASRASQSRGSSNAWWPGSSGPITPWRKAVQEWEDDH